MPKIKLCFSGWVNNLRIKSAYDKQFGDYYCVNHLSSEELVKKLQSGELEIDLVSALRDCDVSSVEFSDFAVADYSL